MRVAGTLLIAALLAGAAVSPAFSAPIVDWDPAYFWEPGATPTLSLPGGQMKIVGIVSAFGGPLAFLNANMPAKEYTFYVSGLTSTGTAPIPPFYITAYNGGTIDIYEDSTPDAVFDPNPPNANVPSTFIDGTLILTGSISNFNTQTNTITPHQTGNAEGNITWNGGSLIALVGNGVGGTCPALFTGGLTWFSDVNIAGYLFRHDGKIDHECPTPTQPSTWGRIKTLYR
jgi:hypothetical protein